MPAQRNEEGVVENSTTTAETSTPRRSNRGFASMDAEKQREIARKGGRAAHMKGTAHEFTSEEARVAGRKGGEAVSRDRNHMAEIGREGGQARGARANQRAQERAHTSNEGSTSFSEGTNLTSEGGNVESFAAASSSSERR